MTVCLVAYIYHNLAEIGHAVYIYGNCSFLLLSKIVSLLVCLFQHELMVVYGS